MGAFEDVKNADIGNERLVGATGGAEQCRGRYCPVQYKGKIAEDGLELAESGRRLGLGGLLARHGQGIEVDFEGGDRSLDVQFGGQRRMEFTEPAEGHLGAERDAAAAARMAPLGGFGKNLDLVDIDAKRVEHGREVGLGVPYG